LPLPRRYRDRGRDGHLWYRCYLISNIIIKWHAIMTLFLEYNNHEGCWLFLFFLVCFFHVEREYRKSSINSLSSRSFYVSAR
jgi:hypothetical protein